MKLNQKTIDQIKKSEGLRLEAYPDPGSKDGKPVTIGYGTTRINGKPISLGTKITKAQAEAYLKADLEHFAKKVASGIKVKLNENQFGALVSFAYNVGLGDPSNPKAPVGFLTSTLLKKLNAGDFASVPKEMRRWNKNDGKVMQGLINRREDEIKLWLDGTAPVVVPLEPTEKPVGEDKTSKTMGGLLALIIAIVGAAVAFFFGGAE